MRGGGGGGGAGLYLRDAFIIILSHYKNIVLRNQYVTLAEAL